MSQQGGYSDNYGDQENESGHQDKLSDAQSDSPEDQQNLEQQLVDNENEEQEQNEESQQQMYYNSSIIEEPTYTVSNTQKITPPFLTKYQKARVIGVRAMQISKNSPLYLNADDKDLSHWDPLFIAQKELAQERIPFIIRRYLPDSSFEDWKLADLKSLD